MRRGAVSTQGALLPRELLDRVDSNDPKLPGMKAVDYGLAPGERVRDAITRSWQRLTGLWVGFRQAETSLTPEDTATSLTRERWLLPLLDELGFAGLPLVQSLSADDGPSDVSGSAGKDYAISHEWADCVPVHLMGWRVDVDRRSPKVRGASKASPHGLVQEFLNRSDQHLWGIVSNGRVLRLLRDNASLTRQAYVEFDVAAIFEGDSFADFALLWLCCHRSRFEGDPPHRSLLEQWAQEAISAGTRARDKLRDGVERAIVVLGGGVLEHPANHTLRARLRGNELAPEELHRQLLRTVYRLLFLLVAEARGLLHPAGVDVEAKRRYELHYSVARLRRLAERRRGGTHSDLWAGLSVTMAAFDVGETEAQLNARAALGLTSLGGFLWSSDDAPDLVDAQISNACLLEAIRNLALVRDDEARLWRQVNYRNLGTEELGSVYESLLELHPKIDPDARTFGFERAAGSERKTTGSYYTPSALISRLLDDALDPVIDKAAAKADPEKALLALKVLDPACGSGHFLIAAAHRIAARLARIREGGTEPSTDMLRVALREVVNRCLYGIDMNPMAVELCKVSLWLEANVAGRPLGFLDHHIACGNSLLGTTPKLLAAGIPDAAFKALTGDDKKHVSALRKRNKAERKAPDQLLLELDYSMAASSARLATEVKRIDAAPEQTAEQVTKKAAEYAAMRAGGLALKEKLIADTWCAAFVARKTSDMPAITDEMLREAKRLTPEQALAMSHSDSSQRGSLLDGSALETIQTLADDYQFTHLHLTFPEVFPVPESLDDATNLQTGWSGGFDAVLGNPPWDQIQYDPRETFAVSHPEIAEAATMAKRTAMIRDLQGVEPETYARYQADQRHLDGLKHFVHASECYPLGSVGRLATAPLFLEFMWNGIAPSGQAGAIVPTGIATDSFTQEFFRQMIERKALISLFDFENAKPLFPSVHRSYKFCLLTLSGSNNPTGQSYFSFFAHESADLESHDRVFELTPEDFALLNPNTRTCPIFRTNRDAEITKAIYRRVPPLIRENDVKGNPWGVEFQLMFMMNSDSHLFLTREELESEGWILQGNHFIRHSTDNRPESCLPLYEGKMIHQFDHRWATFENGDFRDVRADEKEDPTYCPLPRYWIMESEVDQRNEFVQHWLLGWRDVTRATERRTWVACPHPVGAASDTLLQIQFLSEQWSTESTSQPMGILHTVINSFPSDYVARQKVGGIHMKFFTTKQLPVSPPSYLSCGDHGLVQFISERTVELSYTAWDMEQFARTLGYKCSPYRWCDERRSLISVELDALMFHLYGVDRDDTMYMMNTFSKIKRNDEKEYGQFRTRDLIIERYDAMTQAYKAAHGTLTDTPNSTTPPHDQASLIHYSHRLSEALASHYETNISPPSAHPSQTHSESTRPSWLNSPYSSS